MGFRDEGGSDVGMSKSLPSFGSHDGGVILRAAINHYKAISPITVVVLAEIASVSACALRRPVGRLIKTFDLGLAGGNLTD